MFEMISMVWKIQLHMFNIYPKTKSAHFSVFKRETVLGEGWACLCITGALCIYTVRMRQKLTR